MPEVRGFPGLGRTRVMGVVNATPDSFSDGGVLDGVDGAVRHGLQLLTDGADLVDVGGESTRPGAERVPASEELHRVLPVVQGLVAAGAVVSVDTMRASVAEAALGAGARMVNDVSGGLADPAMLPLVAEAGVAYVAMHWRGHSSDMQGRAVYDDVVDDVAVELLRRADAAVSAGVDPERLLLDPGLGFAKTAAHSWAVLRRLDVLTGLGRPLLVGASRKGFLGSLLADADGSPRPVRERDAATAAVTVLAAQAGAWAVRVHEARSSVDAVRVVAQVGA
ncbi:dihydropteroate synthase [soil metagenome]